MAAFRKVNDTEPVNATRNPNERNDMSMELINLQATRAMREADLEMAIDLAERRPSLGDAEWIATCNKRVEDAHEAISRHLGLAVTA
jgi:hypothetical protein